MAQVKKFALGNRISRKESREIDEQYRRAMEGYTDEQKQWANGYMSDVALDQIEGGYNHRTRRQNTSAAQLQAMKQMNGEEALQQTPVSVNPFGGMTSEESRRRAEQVRYDYNHRSGTPSEEAQDASFKSGRKGKFRFNPLGGYDAGYLTTDATLNDRAGMFLGAIARNVSALVDADNAKKRLIMPDGLEAGAAMSTLGVFNKYLNFNWDTATNAQKNAAFKELIPAIGTLGISPDVLKSVFPEFYRELTQAEKNQRALRNSGYTDVTDNQWLLDQGKKAGINFMYDKDHKLRAYDKDFNDYGQAFSFIDDAYTNDGTNLVKGANYGRTLLINEDGSAWTGLDTDIMDDQNHEYFDAYNAAKQVLFGQRDQLATTDGQYNRTFSVGMEGDQLTENPLLRDTIKLLNAEDIDYADVSNLFGGDNQVIAANANGLKYKQDAYGNVVFEPGTQFFYVDNDGKVKQGTFAQVNAALKYRQTGYGESNLQTGHVTNLSSDYDQANILDLGSDIAGRSFWDIAKYYAGSMGTAGATGGAAIGAAAGLGVGSVPGSVVGGIIGAIGGAAAGLGTAAIHYNSLDNIKEDPEFFVDNILESVVNPEHEVELAGMNMGAQEFLGQFDLDKLTDTMLYFYKTRPGWFKQYPKRMLALRQLVIRKHNGGSTTVAQEGGVLNFDEFSVQWQADFSESLKNNKARRLKEGGQILYAAKGAVVDPITGRPLGEKAPVSAEFEALDKANQLADKRVAEAKEAGFDNVKRYEAANRALGDGLDASDYLRIASMAQDVASIVAAFAPGAGTAAAAGLGLTSLGTDLVADFVDDSVTLGQAVKNAAVNAAFVGVGMIPGAKLSKVTKNLVKWAPKLIAAYGTYATAVDPGVQASLKKLTTGEKITHQDLLNYNQALKVIAMGTRAGAGRVRKNMAKSKIAAAEEEAARDLGLEKTGTDTTFKKGKVNLNNEELMKLMEFASKGDAKGAKDYIKTTMEGKGVTITDAEAAEAVKVSGGHKKYGLWGEKVGEKVELAGDLEANTSVEAHTLAQKRVMADEAKMMRQLANNKYGIVRSMTRGINRMANLAGGGAYTDAQRAVMSQVGQYYISPREETKTSRWSSKAGDTRAINRTINQNLKKVQDHRFAAELEALRGDQAFKDVSAGKNGADNKNLKAVDERLAAEQAKKSDIRNNALISEIESGKTKGQQFITDGDARLKKLTRIATRQAKAEWDAKHPGTPAPEEYINSRVRKALGSEAYAEKGKGETGNQYLIEEATTRRQTLGERNNAIAEEKNAKAAEARQARNDAAAKQRAFESEVNKGLKNINTEADRQARLKSVRAELSKSPSPEREAVLRETERVLQRNDTNSLKQRVMRAEKRVSDVRAKLSGYKGSKPTTIKGYEQAQEYRKAIAESGSARDKKVAGTAGKIDTSAIKPKAPSYDVSTKEGRAKHDAVLSTTKEGKNVVRNLDKAKSDLDIARKKVTDAQNAESTAKKEVAAKEAKKAAAKGKKARQAQRELDAAKEKLTKATEALKAAREALKSPVNAYRKAGADYKKFRPSTKPGHTLENAIKEKAKNGGNFSAEFKKLIAAGFSEAEAIYIIGHKQGGTLQRLQAFKNKK